MGKLGGESARFLVALGGLALELRVALAADLGAGFAIFLVMVVALLDLLGLLDDAVCFFCLPV